MARKDWQTVAQQAVDPRWAGKGPQGQNLVAWRNQKTGKTISGSDWGNSAYAEPVWGPAPKKERKEKGGEGGGGGGGPAGEQLPIYNPLYDTILADLNKNNFGPDEQNLFNQRMNQSLDRINLNAETVRRTSAGNLLGTGSFGSGGELTESFKNIGEAQTSDTMTTLDQLAKDEQTYLQGIRDRGIASANQLFNTSLQARTKYNIAKEQAKLAEIMNANALKFAAEQADLNRALEREKLGAMLASGSRGNTLGNISSFIGGAISTASLFR